MLTHLSKHQMNSFDERPIWVPKYLQPILFAANAEAILIARAINYMMTAMGLVSQETLIASANIANYFVQTMQKFLKKRELLN